MSLLSIQKVLTHVPKGLEVNLTHKKLHSRTRSQPAQGSSSPVRQEIRAPQVGH